MRSWPGILLATLLLCFGCSKRADQIDHKWSPPIAVAQSLQGVDGSVNLYKWHSTIIALQTQYDKTAKCLMMNQSGNGSNFWTEVPYTGVPREYFGAFPKMDQASDRVFFDQGYIENEQLVMNVLVGRMTGRISVRDVAERKWTTDTQRLFGEAHPNVRFAEFNEPGKRNWPVLGLGIINGSDLYIPYCIDAFTYRNGSAIARGPYYSGVFHSTDSGKTWQMEKISGLNSGGPSVSQSKSYYYYFATTIVPAHGYQLWFSRKPVKGSSWGTPQTLTMTFASVDGRYTAVSDDDTVHVCWMDCRHDKWRVNMDGPLIENDDIVYRQRTDSDAEWSKEVTLSKGLLYSYAPSMSVEGDRIVVAWAGIQSAGKQHTYYDPNDIYYVTSKDSGKTWAEPLKVTDGAKDGVTAGYPQVMLLNGVIHLLYTQGKRESQQISPGLTKLGQDPWPIYYTHRPFPD